MCLSAFLLHSITIRKDNARPILISEKENLVMVLKQPTNQIHFSSRESSYFHYVNEPYITRKNNSRCDDVSLRNERRQFERTYEIVFGKKPND